MNDTITDLFSANTNEMLVNLDTGGMTMSAIKFHQEEFRKRVGDRVEVMELFQVQLIRVFKSHLMTRIT